MAKKLTKKELKAIEAKKMEEMTNKFRARQEFINSIKSYWDDIMATERFYKINDVKDKLNYNGSLKKEEVDRLFSRYENLAFIKDLEKNSDNNVWAIIRKLMDTYNRSYEDYDYKFVKDIDVNSILIDDIFWSEDQVETLIKLGRMFGYKTVNFFDHSTAALGSIACFIRNGCKVIGVNEKLRKTWGDKDTYKHDSDGIIISIEEVEEDA